MSPVHVGAIVVPVHADSRSLVEIRWHLDDGAIYYQRVAIPPKATREAQGTIMPATTDAASAASQAVYETTSGPVLAPREL
jgi:hypothetical protein